MEYMTTKEAAELWGLSVRRVQVLCEENRVEGAVKFGNVWAIPKGEERPQDARIKSGQCIAWRNKEEEK